jgi:hypothetical protein
LLSDRSDPLPIWCDLFFVNPVVQSVAQSDLYPLAISRFFPLSRARPLVERHGTGNASRIGDGEPATTTADRELIERHVARVIIKPQALEVCLVPTGEEQVKDPSVHDPARRSQRERAGQRSAHIRLAFPVPCRSTKGRARDKREMQSRAAWTYGCGQWMETMNGHRC